MKLSRISISLALFLLVLLSLTAIGFTAEKGLTIRDTSMPSLVSDYHGSETETYFASNSDGGINEIIPAKYATRYLAWKKDFLSTQAGRDQWAKYENNPNFSLTIAVSSENAEALPLGNTVGTSRANWWRRRSLWVAVWTMAIRIRSIFR
jgi:hypothetical protein